MSRKDVEKVKDTVLQPYGYEESNKTEVVEKKKKTLYFRKEFGDCIS